jgi:hypothetical protein
MTATSRQLPETATEMRFYRHSVPHMNHTGLDNFKSTCRDVLGSLEHCLRSVTPSRLRQVPTCGRFQNSHLTHENCYVGKLHSGRQHRSLHWKRRVWLMVPQTSDVFNTLISFLIIINDGNAVTWLGSSVASSPHTHPLHCIPETPRHSIFGLLSLHRRLGWLWLLGNISIATQWVPDPSVHVMAFVGVRFIMVFTQFLFP